MNYLEREIYSIADFYIDLILMLDSQEEGFKLQKVKL